MFYFVLLNNKVSKERPLPGLQCERKWRAKTGLEINQSDEDEGSGDVVISRGLGLSSPAR